MTRPLAILIFTLASIYSIPSMGHHSWDAVYGDGEEIVVVATVVSDVRRNPHWTVDIEFANEQGYIETWAIEWRDMRNSGPDTDPVLGLLSTGESYEISGRMAHVAGKQSIQVKELTRLSDGQTGAASRY